MRKGTRGGSRTLVVHLRARTDTAVRGASHDAPTITPPEGPPAVWRGRKAERPATIAAWAAREAGLGAHFTALADIGLSEDGQFADDRDRVIGTLFKLYPWEDMLRDDFAAHLQPSQTRFIEPPWKAVLSNKGILPLLWQMFPDHPNLLPAFFAADIEAARRGERNGFTDAIARAEPQLSRGHVAKPVFSREGAGVVITEAGREVERAPVRRAPDAATGRLVDRGAPGRLLLMR